MFYFHCCHVQFLWWKEDKIDFFREPLSWVGYSLFTGTIVITAIRHNYSNLIDGNASKPYISKMHNVQETQKTVSKQTRNRVFATSKMPFL